MFLNAEYCMSDIIALHFQHKIQVCKNEISSVFKRLQRSTKERLVQ